MALCYLRWSLVLDSVCVWAGAASPFEDHIWTCCRLQKGLHLPYHHRPLMLHTNASRSRILSVRVSGAIVFCKTGGLKFLTETRNRDKVHPRRIIFGAAFDEMMMLLCLPLTVRLGQKARDPTRGAHKSAHFWDILRICSPSQVVVLPDCHTTGWPLVGWCGPRLGSQDDHWNGWFGDLDLS